MIAAVIGTVVSGRITDVIVRRGHLEARVWMPAVCYLAAAVLFIPGILGSHLTPALYFDMGGAALLSAANPPLDAARLDIMPPGCGGARRARERSRARSRRRSGRSSSACFADLIEGIAPSPAPIGTHTGVIALEERHRPGIQLPDPADDTRRCRACSCSAPSHLPARRRDRGGVAGRRARRGAANRGGLSAGSETRSRAAAGRAPAARPLSRAAGRRPVRSSRRSWRSPSGRRGRALRTRPASVGRCRRGRGGRHAGTGRP